MKFRDPSNDRQPELHTGLTIAQPSNRNRWDDNSGFWPGDVAAGVAADAVSTAAGIATAPIGGDAYARRNGFVCIPGTWFRGEDGRRHLCQ
jgi:hypothetical protein